MIHECPANENEKISIEFPKQNKINSLSLIKSYLETPHRL